MAKEKVLMIRLPKKLKDEFKAYAALKGLSMSEVTQELLEVWVAKNIPHTPRKTEDSE